MKKLLGILVLGLLLGGCTTGAQLISEGKIYKGMTKNQLCTVTLGTPLSTASYSEDPCIKPYFSEYFSHSNQEIWYAHGKSVFYVYKDVTIPRREGNGTLQTWTFSYSDAKNLITPEKIVKKPKKVEPNTTEPSLDDKKVAASSGSAFFVSNTGYIITNFHVIETCNDNSKIFYKTNKIDTKLIAKDEYLDLALLKAEVSNNKFIRISNKAPRKLQRIIAAGYPFGKYLSDDMKFTSGIVSSLKGIKNDSTRLQIDAALNPGNSGGPIVDENTGELVAVAVAGLRKDITESVNYGIKSASVKNFLESNQIDPSTFSIKFGIGNIAEHLENTVLYTFCN